MNLLIAYKLSSDSFFTMAQAKQAECSALTAFQLHLRKLKMI